MEFSQFLLQLRNAKGLKQQEVADGLGISLRAYQYYEQGEREPQLSLLVRMADYYDISLDELAGRRKQKAKLSENLLLFRENAGLSQAAVAESIGVGVRAYQNYEYGTRVPPLETVVALADLFDVSLDELVGREK